jgi:hypothetical protein
MQGPIAKKERRAKRTARRPIMKPALDIRPVRLPRRAIHSIENGGGLEVTAVSGTVWITQSMDARDVILARGQSFVLDRKGRAVIYALKDAAIVIGPAWYVTAADPSATAALTTAA